MQRKPNRGARKCGAEKRTLTPSKLARSLVASLCATTLVTASCRAGGGGPEDPPDRDPQTVFEVDGVDQQAGGNWLAELEQLRNQPVVFAQSAEVGALPGRSWVDDSGGAHYSIPIDVAPGPNGFAPSLSLQYSSRSGNGLYGVGFSVATGALVQRCQRTMAKDGYYEELHMDETDPVCYGGQRLVLEGGVYGATGSTYRLETDLSKRFRLAVGSLDDSTSVAVWELDTAEGDTFRFRGYDSLRGRWLLDSVTDPFGNRMEYNWDELANHEFVLASIFYGGGTSSQESAKRKVVFGTSADRPDVREGYIRGERYELTRRVNEIRAEGPHGEVVARYVLEYDVHPHTQQSVLTSVTRYDAAGQSLPATTFDWVDNGAPAVTDSISRGVAPNSGWTEGFGLKEHLARRGTAAIADLNGDLRTDVLVFDEAEDAYIVNGEHAFLSAHESTRPGGWGRIVADERRPVEHQTYLDFPGTLPTHDFEEFLSIYRGRHDEYLFDDEFAYESFRDHVRSELAPRLDHRVHQVQPQLGLSRIKFSTEDRQDQLLVPIATESPLDDGVDEWGVSIATLLRVAVPISDWEDPSGSGTLEFQNVDFPLPADAPAYSVVTLEYNGDGRDDLFVCQGHGYKSSRWHLWLTRDVANTENGTYGWDVHDTGVECSSHDEYTVLPHARGTEVLAVIPRFENHPEPDSFANPDAYRDASLYTVPESQRTGYRVLEHDPSTDTWGLGTDEVLPRDLYQRTTDRYCNNGFVAANLTDVPAGQAGAPLLGAGLSRDRAVDINGDGLLDLIRFELSGGDTSANLAILEETQDDGAGYASRAPSCWNLAGQSGVLRVYQNTGEGYEALPAFFTFPGSPHANLWVNWYGAQIVDWNADGLMDLTMPSDGVPTDDGSPDRDWVLLLSDGNGSFTEMPFEGPDWPHYVDGANTADIFAEQSYRRTLAARGDDGSVIQLFLEPGQPSRALSSGQDDGARLERATDGFGQWDAFRYRLTSSGRHVVRERATRVPSVEPADDDGIYEADRNWRYEYLDPVLDPYGNELGYASVRESLVRSNIVVSGADPASRQVQRRFYDWTYDPDVRGYPYAAGPSIVESYSSADWLLLTGTPRLSCSVVENWALDSQTIAGGQIWQSYAESSESFTALAPTFDPQHTGSASQCADYELIDYQTYTTAAQTRDQYGNIVESTQRAEVGVNEVTETVTVVDEPNYDHANWRIAIPTQFTTISTSGADTKQRTTTLWYEPGELVPESVYRELGTPFQQETRFTYDDYGNVEVIQQSAEGEDPRWVRTTWDAEGVSALSVENTLGHATHYVVHAATGVPVATADPNGFTQRIEYDGFFRPVGGSYHSSPLGPSDGSDVAIEYAASAVPGAVFDEVVERRGQRIVSSYDVAGRPVREQWRGVGETSSFPASSSLLGPDICRWHQYDVYDNELATSEATSACSAPPVGDEHWVTRRFDASSRNRVTQWYDDGVQVASQTEFDGLSWPAVAAGLGIDAVDGVAVQAIGPDNNPTTTVIDALGRTSATVDAVGTMTCFDYGPFGELEAVTRNCAYGAAGPVETSTYAYDEISRLESWDEPARGMQTYTYTGFDELETVTDAKAQVIEHIYDEIGRLRVRNSPDCTARWAYDHELIGALSYQVSEDGVRDEFSYDAFGRVERTEHTVPGMTPDGSWAFEYGYDAEGRLGSITYPTGVLSPLGADAPATFSATFDYDGSDHLRSVRGAGRVLWALNSANDAGQPLLETFNVNHVLPTQSRTSSYHTFTQRIDSIRVQAGEGGSAVDVQHFDHEWSPGGNLLHRAELTTGQQETFGYDSLDRLTTINGSTVASYDVLGNFTGRDGVGDYAYDTATGRLDWFGDPSNQVQHDANGNVRRIGDLELVWNPFDRVERTTHNGEQLDFSYDANGSRVGRFDGTGSTLTLGGLFEFSDDAGGTNERRARYFVPAGGSKVEVRDTEGAPGVWSREVLYQHTDYLGSGSVLVADDGTVEQRVSYDAWGQARDWFQWNQSFDPALLQEFAAGYTGHQPELDAGLVNMRGRMYSPEIARFLSVDPVVEGVGDAQTWNGYSYVLNNPMRYTDPSGFSAEPGCHQFPDADGCEEGTDAGGNKWARAWYGPDGDRGGVPQSVPQHDSGQTGNTSSDTANTAGGNGGKSGTGGGNARGEGGPAMQEYNDFWEREDPNFKAQRDAERAEAKRIREGRARAKTKVSATPDQGPMCTAGALCDGPGEVARRSRGGTGYMTVVAGATTVAIAAAIGGPAAIQAYKTARALAWYAVGSTYAWAATCGTGSSRASAGCSSSSEKTRKLSTQAQRSLRTLSQRLAEHKAKLDAYRKNPGAFDNKGFLKNAPSLEVRKNIIEGRIRHLENEISNFEKQIADILAGG